jgi:hypothetical protein
MNDWMTEFCESPKVAWLVIVFVALCLLVATAGAASMVAKDQLGNSVTLHETPCSVQEVLDAIKDEMRHKFRNAELRYLGKEFRACWAVGPDGRVYVIDETKEYLTLPMGAFVPLLGS